MPRNRSIMAWVVTLALAVAAAGCGGGGGSDDAASTGVTVDAPELSAAASAGLTVFQSKCAVCHHSDLSGGAGPALGPASAAASKPIDELRSIITNGRGGMPSWGGVLSAQQIDDVLAFLAEAQSR